MELRIPFGSNAKKVYVVTVIAVLVIGTFLFMRSRQSAPPSVLGDFPRPSQGDQKAIMSIVEYSDLQCPACRAAQGPLNEFFKKHALEVRWTSFAFPLPQHKNAMKAANAAYCAFDQSKYWEFAEVTFEKQGEWSDLPNPMPKFKEYMGSVGGDAEAMEKCALAETHAEKIRQDVESGVAADITGTPTFFVNGQRFVGGMSVEGWEKKLAEIQSSSGPRKAQ